MNGHELHIGQRVRCWGIFGGPFPGKIKAKGQSKDCWLVAIKKGSLYMKVELHQDYLRPKT